MVPNTKWVCRCVHEKYLNLFNIKYEGTTKTEGLVLVRIVPLNLSSPFFFGNWIVITHNLFDKISHQN